MIYFGSNQPDPCETNAFNNCHDELTFTFPNCYTDTEFCGKDVTPNSCGTTCGWNYDETSKTLTITGSGDMYDLQHLKNQIGQI